MINPVHRTLIGSLGLLLVLSSQPARADKPVPASELAVDQVTVKGGPRLLGGVLGQERDGHLVFAVRRDWLRHVHTQYFETQIQAETASTEAALRELQTRIAAWREARPPDGALDLFLKDEAARINKELDAAKSGTRQETAPFLIVELAPGRFERLVHQPLQRRTIARQAWRDQLADVETRSAASLAQELKKQQAAALEDHDPLLDLLPPRRESTSAWDVRKALVEYQFRKPFDFQGTGDVVLPVTNGQPAADVAKLIEELVKSLTSGSLEDLLDAATGKGPANAPGAAAGRGPAAEKWLATASQAAQTADVLAFRITQVQQQLEAKRVEVVVRFVVRMADGTWKPAWQTVETADASKPRPDAERQIIEDPQVKRVLGVIRTIGLGGEEQLAVAIRFGAATQEAQKAAEARFFQFRDRYTRQLDTPLLPLEFATPEPKPATREPTRPRRAPGGKAK